jgi:catechol 2,3-dioxygenase-like lactoylglutathione lyase family enzyme
MSSVLTPGDRKRILHISFIVKDLRDSMQAFLDLYGIGPWFVFEHQPIESLKYRGAPATMDISAAIAFSGSLMLELIQQHDSSPSACTDLVRARGYGFHHFAVPANNLDEEVARYRARGFAVVNEAAAPSGRGGGSSAYIDTTAELPGMTELTEVAPQLLETLRQLEDIAAHWDGSDPVRVQKRG